MNGKLFCAHRGLSGLMPENTLPAFAAAYAFGADEIEFDIRLTRDARLVVSHDPKLERISDGTGKINEHTLAELREMNIGAGRGWQVSFCTPEEVFALLGGKIRFNIHLKEHGEEGYIIRELVKIAAANHAEDAFYFAGSPSELEWMQRVAPGTERTAIQLPRDTEEIYDMAREFSCTRVQFWLDMFDRELIQRMHDAGIACNLFFADTPEDYDRYFGMGIDTLLTNRMDIAARYRAGK